MPWNSGSGDGGGSKGGNNRPGNSNSPWGGPRKGGSSGGGQGPSDIDDLIRKGQERMRGLFPDGGQGPRAIIIGLCILLLAWASTGIYKVAPDEQGVELVFGKYDRSTEPGLHYRYPVPIGSVTKVSVTKVRQINMGGQANDVSRRYTAASRERDERQILTADQNVVDVDYTVFWRVSKAEDYLFNIRGVEATILRVTESVMREVAGRSSLDQLMTDRKEALQVEVTNEVQKLLDLYGAGVEVTDVKLLAVDPPRQVIEAFHDVNNARQDLDRQRNEALAYRNDILPRAKGEAEKMIQDAMAYKARQTKDAEGEADRFNSVYKSFKAAENVTTKRLYLETMQDVLGGANKIIMDSKAGSGVVPYLPLPEIKKRAAAKGGK